MSVSRHFLLQVPQCPCSVRKRFSRNHCCRGRSKPGCWIVVAHKLMTLYMAEILPAKFYQILTMLRRQQVLYWTGTEPLGLINTIGYQKREIIRWLSVNRQCNNTINSFYFMIFYQSIRHAILLSIVLTLLSSVL